MSGDSICCPCLFFFLNNMARRKTPDNVDTLEVQADGIGMVAGMDLNPGDTFVLTQRSTPVIKIFGQSIGPLNMVLTIPEIYSKEDIVKLDQLLRKNILVREEIVEDSPTPQGFNKPDFIVNWFKSRLSARFDEFKGSVAALVCYRKKIQGWSPKEILELMLDHENKSKVRANYIQFLNEAIRVCPSHGIVNEEFDQDNFISAEFYYPNKNSAKFVTRG